MLDMNTLSILNLKDLYLLIDLLYPVNHHTHHRNSPLHQPNAAYRNGNGISANPFGDLDIKGMDLLNYILLMIDAML